MGKKIAKWIFGILATFLVLLTLLVCILQFEAPQNWLKDKTTNYLSQKIGAKFYIGHLKTNFISELYVNEILVEDQSKKQLLKIGQLKIQFKLFDFIKNNININAVQVDNLQLYIHRSERDSIFNFDFISKVFLDSGNQITTKTPKKNNYQIQLGKLELKNISLLMDDKWAGQYYHISSSELLCVSKEIDLLKAEFHLNSLIVKEFNAEILHRNTITTSNEKSSNISLPIVKLDTLEIGLKQFRLEMPSANMKFHVDDNQLLAQNLEFDGAKHKVNLKSIEVSGKRTGLVLIGNTSEIPKTVDSVSAQHIDSYSLNITHLKLLEDSTFFQKIANPKLVKNRVDYNYIQLKEFQLVVDSINTLNNSYSIQLNNLKFQERSGLTVAHVKANIQYSEKETNISKLDLATTESIVKADLLAKYESLAAIEKNIGTAKLKAEFKQIHISKKDLGYLGLDQQTNLYLQKILSSDIDLSGQVNGQINNLSLANLKFRNSGFDIMLAGRIQGLPDPNRVFTNLQIKSITGSTEKLKAILPPDLIPTNITLPEKFSLSGKFNGGAKNPMFDLLIKSSDGDIVVKGWLKELDSPEKYAYDLYAKTEEFHIEKLLKDSIYGKTSFELKATGRGISPKELNANIDFVLPEIFLKGYTYHNLYFKTNIKQSLLEINLNTNDPGLHSTGILKYSFDSVHPLLYSDLDILKLDLHQLGFSSDSLVIETKIKTNLDQVNQNHLNGTIFLPDLVIKANGERIDLDSCYLNSSYKNSIQKLELKLPFSKMSIEGKYQIASLPEVAKQILFSYLSKSTLEKNKLDLPECVAEFDLGIYDHPVLHNLFPELGGFKGLGISGKLDAKKRGLFLLGIMPFIQYGNMHVDSTFFTSGIYNDSLHLDLIASNINYSALNVHHAYLSTHAKDGAMNSGLKIFNTDDIVTYDINGTIDNEGSSFLLRLKDSLLLNSERWYTNPNNLIKYESVSAINANLELNAGIKKVMAKSVPNSKGFPMKLELDDFPISTFTKINQSDTAMIDGIINGSISLEHLQPFRFIGNIELDNLTTYGNNIGSVHILAANDAQDDIQANLNLFGNGNAASLTAIIKDAGDLAGSLKVDSLSFSSVGPLLKKYFSNLNGHAWGNINFKGTVKKPILQGELYVKSTSAIYNDYNTYASIDSGLISFNKRGVLLHDLMVKDSLGNTAKINGTVLTTTYFDYQYDLQIDTDHFLAVNKKRNKDQHIYGPISISSDLKLISKTNYLLVSGDIVVDDNSIVNFEMEDETANLETTDGIIEYYNSLKKVPSIQKQLDIHETVYKEKPLKMAFDLNLEITKKSILNIILDQEGGDYLKASGDASLSVTENESGKMSVFGMYTVENGEYILTLNEFIKRKFIIQKGGTIKWDGNPMNGVIDLTALYTVTTSVESLLSSAQSVSGDAYKQRLPFEILLYLKNKMTKPEIRFKLDMPEKDRNAMEGTVYARVKQINLQESELNKQVMGLLVLNSFIPQNPLASAGTGFSLDVESTARTTAGKLLSQQMNNLAGALIKDFDLSFDLNSSTDYSSGSKQGQTDLAVNVSKKLFNERTVVTVGSTFALEGSDEHKHNTSGFAGNVSVEYKITQNGKYRVKVYRNNQYETVIDGQVVQTGLSFVLFVDFNKYRELFQFRNKK